ncbi:MAG: kelch repeat-containing protein [Planctomycetota bacterium]
MRPSPWIVALFAPLLPSAQELSWTDGVLGSGVTYTLSGDPSELWGLGVSLNSGPTPLAIVDPADPRFFDLGLELLPYWLFGSLSPAGEATQTFFLPNTPMIVGVPLHAQFFTLPGATTFVDDISNDVSFAMQVPASTAQAVGERGGAIDGHSSTSLPDGSVLLAGGVDVAGGGDVALATLEVFDPQTQSFEPHSATLAAPRRAHTATLLTDGRVLLLGGRDGAGLATAAAELFDPVAGTVTQVASMPQARSQHTATLLADGRVLVAGGVELDDPADPITTLLSVLVSTAIYDPVLDAWSSGPELPAGRIGHAASLLDSGEVFVTGGIEVSSLFGFPTQDWTETCLLLDPALGTALPTASMPGPRAYHAQVVLSTDGRVLVTGGARTGVFLEQVTLDEVVRYNPTLDVWAELPTRLNQPRAYHALLETPTQLAVIGGIAVIDSMALTETPEASVELAPPDASTWAAPLAMQLPRARVRASLVDGGERILVTGTGDDGGAGDDLSAEIVLP